MYIYINLHIYIYIHILYVYRPRTRHKTTTYICIQGRCLGVRVLKKKKTLYMHTRAVLSLQRLHHAAFFLHMFFFTQIKKNISFIYIYTPGRCSRSRTASSRCPSCQVLVLRLNLFFSFSCFFLSLTNGVILLPSRKGLGLWF